MEELVGELERRSMVQQAHRQTQTEAQAALAPFEAKHRAISRDQDLGQVGITVLARELKSDLRAAGVEEDALARVGDNIHGVHELAIAVGALRQNGYKVRSFDEHLDAAGAHLTKKFGHGARSMVGTASEIEARINRKRAATPQPRASSFRAESTNGPKPPKTAQQIVQEIRKARGFTTS
jgi:hypothetical protein